MISASPLDGGPRPYASMLHSGLCEVTGFEPLPSGRRGLPSFKALNLLVKDTCPMSSTTGKGASKADMQSVKHDQPP